MATWPVDLPEINLDGYMETPPERVIRSSMEVGPQKLRRRSSTAVRKVSITMVLTDDQLDIFEEFYDANDALAFDFTDPRTGAVKRARFANVPKYARNGLSWNFSADMEYLP